jgi:hypothetical protein
MLPGESNLPDAIVRLDGDVVNRLFDFLCHESDRLLTARFVSVFKGLQIDWFMRHNLTCPSCGSRCLIRKGWRERILKSSRGRQELFVLQAHCKTCKRTFRPFTDRSGLPSSRRFLDELINKSLQLATQVSFARSSRIIQQLTQGSISHEGVRQKIAQKAQELEFKTPASGQTVLVDSTKVKAGSKKRGASVHLAITVEPGAKVAGRKTIDKKLMHLHVGSVEPLREQLKKTVPSFLVHDGGEDYTGCAEHIQRCDWHLVHQLNHYLWQDGLPLEERSFYQDCLRPILWDSKSGQRNYAQFAKDLALFGFSNAANHLERAKAEAFTWIKARGFSYITTSPLEREMRELNRRADVGARWSTQGIENVLKVLFHYRHNEKSSGIP